MIANDAFLYFSCITSGFKFRHVRRAKVWYRSPATLKDQLRQSKRFAAAHFRLERLFGDIASEEYAVPRSLRYKEFFLQFIQNPIHSLAILAINRYCKHAARREEKSMNAKWPMALTTKKGI